MKKFCVLVCAIVFSSTLFAEGVSETQLVSQQQRNRNNNGSTSKNMNRDPNTWTPFYIKLKDTEPLSCFYQQTVGIGFLYFSGVKGNLNPVVDLNGTASTKTTKPLQGHIGYNRTPVTEFIIGRDIWHWLKIALSYTQQSGVSIQTKPQAIPNLNRSTQLLAQMRLDAALFRVYFMFPYTLVWKNYYYEPYLSVGVGPSWTTWSDIRTPATIFNNLRMKVSANCAYTVDLGAKLRRAMPTYVLSFTLGCKYTQWGQSRQMGKPSQQFRAANSGLLSPFRITTVYQFAPYIGVQFNF